MEGTVTNPPPGGSGWVDTSYTAGGTTGAGGAGGTAGAGGVKGAAGNSTIVGAGGGSGGGGGKGSGNVDSAHPKLPPAWGYSPAANVLAILQDYMTATLNSAQDQAKLQGQWDKQTANMAQTVQEGAVTAANEGYAAGVAQANQTMVQGVTMLVGAGVSAGGTAAAHVGTRGERANKEATLKDHDEKITKLTKEETALKSSSPPTRPAPAAGTITAGNEPAGAPSAAHQKEIDDKSAEIKAAKKERRNDERSCNASIDQERNYIKGHATDLSNAISGGGKLFEASFQLDAATDKQQQDIQNARNQYLQSVQNLYSSQSQNAQGNFQLLLGLIDNLTATQGKLADAIAAASRG